LGITSLRISSLFCIPSEGNGISLSSKNVPFLLRLKMEIGKTAGNESQGSRLTLVSLTVDTVKFKEGKNKLNEVIVFFKRNFKNF
jgi:hypothetical protein